MQHISVRQTVENDIVTKVEIANLTMAVSFRDADDRYPESFTIDQIQGLPIGSWADGDLGRCLAQLLRLRLGKGIKGFAYPVYVNLTVERLPNP